MAERLMIDGDPLLTAAEVAAVFRVDPKTIGRWALTGKIGYVPLPSGHRRYRESEVRRLAATRGGNSS